MLHENLIDTKCCCLSFFSFSRCFHFPHLIEEVSCRACGKKFARKDKAKDHYQRCTEALLKF